MISFPNCKINLGLTVLNKRSDGYHDLETIFCPVSLTDALEITSHEKTALHPVINPVEFTNTGLRIDGIADANLCVKAYHLLKKDFPGIAPVQIHLHKKIPMGAGLGGGSADAAFTLMLLNEYFELILTKQQLIEYAVQLGSDCPFFIINRPCFATSRGETLEQLPMDLARYLIVLVDCKIHINTGWAFSQLNKPGANELSHSALSLKEIVKQPIDRWKGELINDFELPVFKSFPRIGLIKNELYAKGALYASMTGSGSTVFAIFEKGGIPEFNFEDADTFIVHAMDQSVPE